MKRNSMNDLIQWNQNPNKTPFVLNGIKGAGKTYLALDFAKSFYEGSIYVNFEMDAGIASVFEQNEKNGHPRDFLQIIYGHYQIPEVIAGILLILDEMQSSPSAYLSFIKTADRIKGMACILITSEINSFKEAVCGSFKSVRLFPLGFDEFLTAGGYEWYVEVIKAHTKNSRKIPEIVHNELLSLFEDYLEVGGMPAAVNEYLSMESAENIGQIQENIFSCIKMYNISKYPESHSLKMMQIYDALESQILKEHPKFQYRSIRRGAAYAMYKDAVSDLKQSGQILKCNKFLEYDKQKILYKESSFKLYYFDTGILHYLLKKNNAAVQMPPEKIQKILIANYAMQCLSAEGYRVYFWESGSQARIDFIIRTKDGIVPFDIRMNDTKRSKSISVLKQEYDFPYSIKLSSKNFDLQNQTKIVPYYALFSIIDVVNCMN